MWKREILCIVASLSGLLCTHPENALAQSTQNQATIVIAPDAPTKTYDPMIYGGFIEHLGRQIYGGFFEPGSPLADEQGV